VVLLSHTQFEGFKYLSLNTLFNTSAVIGGGEFALQYEMELLDQRDSCGSGHFYRNNTPDEGQQARNPPRETKGYSVVSKLEI